MALAAAVQRELRSEDKTLIARDFVRTANGARTNVVLSVVAHPYKAAGAVEHAVFMFTRNLFGRLRLGGVFCITGDFFLTVTGERECELHFSAESVLQVEAQSGEALNSFIEAVALAEDSAKSARPPPGVQPFGWLAPYLPAAVPRQDRRAVSDDEGGAAAGAGSADDIDALSACLQRVTPSPSPSSSEAGAAPGPAPSPSPPPAMLLDSRKIVRAREAWVRRQMKAREAEYTDYVPLRIACCTWNVNGRPPPEDLGDWVDPAGGYDVVAVGFQEIVPLNANSVLWGEVSPEVTGPWERRIADRLASAGGRYAQVASRQLVGVHLVVFVKQDLVDSGAAKATGLDAAGVGVMGVLGNKGGVGCRLLLHDSAFHFITAHLSAHDANVERRNYDQREILRRLNFGGPPPAEPIGALDCDALFVFGDLNYRIALSPALMLSDVEACLKSGSWSKMLAADQLMTEMRAGRSFEGFEEALSLRFSWARAAHVALALLCHPRLLPYGFSEHERRWSRAIDFGPTYKYELNSAEYVRRKDGGLRPPAWCDRVLWSVPPSASSPSPSAENKKRNEDPSSSSSPSPSPKEERSSKGERSSAVSLRSYRRHELAASDHRPVSASFELLGRRVERAREAAVVEALHRRLDALENDSLPQFVAAWRLVPKPGDERVCAPWLRVEPQEGIVGPGESAEITLTAHVTRRTAARLTEEGVPLEEIVVLHLDRGRDYFITATGRYVRSCFGCSLDYLAARSEPVRGPPPPAGEEHVPSPRRARVPREIIRLVEHLMEPESNMGQRGLFLEGGDPAEVAALRDCLDTGEPFPPSASILSVAETLVRLLDSLETPVVPLPAQARLIAPLALPTSFGANLPALPDPSEVMASTPVHLVTFSYIAAFLREILRHSETNRLSPDDVAAVFAEVLLRPPGAGAAGAAGGAAGGAGREASRRRRAFLAQYLNSL
eukprot:tig00020563_g11344.t1